MRTILRRYTTLPFIFDYLHSRELVLANPALWDDRNDSYYIEQYAKIEQLSQVYALCFAEANETYHHWRVFSHGNGGACMEFDKDLLLASVLKVNGLRAENVRYETIDNMRNLALAKQDLPFLKRYVYRDEREFRLFYGVKKKADAIFRCSVPLKSLRRITLSPWLPNSAAKHVKKSIKAIDGCANLKVCHSTLVENENWKKFAHRAVDEVE